MQEEYDEAEERRMRAANVAEGEKILAEIHRVQERQHYWKGVLEDANRTEAEQGMQMAALSKEVLLEEVMSLENEEFVAWIAERDKRHGRAGSSEEGVSSGPSKSEWASVSAAILANGDGGAPPPQQRIGTLKTEPDDIAGLNSWYHRDELALETPFSALVPYPRKLTAEGRRFFVDAVDGLFDDGGCHDPLYVTTISELASPAQLIRLASPSPMAASKSAAPTKRLEYTHTPCVSGEDVVVVISRSEASIVTPSTSADGLREEQEDVTLTEALQQTPCVFLSHRPLDAFEVAKVAVVGGRFVAAEVYPSESLMQQAGGGAAGLAAVRPDLETFVQESILSHMPGRTLLALVACVTAPKRPTGKRWVLLNIGSFSGAELSSCFSRRDIFTIAHAMQLMTRELERKAAALDAANEGDPRTVTSSPSSSAQMAAIVQRCIPPTIRYFYNGACINSTQVAAHGAADSRGGALAQHIAEERLAAAVASADTAASDAKQAGSKTPSSSSTCEANPSAATTTSPSTAAGHSTQSLVVAVGLSAAISTGIAMLLMSRRR